MTQRTALVTGANRGIGAEIVKQLRARGLHVVATSREPREGFEALDVTRDDQAAALGERMRATGLDVVVHNAGISLDGFDAEVARRTLDTNFFGVLRVHDALLPVIRPGGRIVMISSGMGSLGGVSGALRERLLDPALDRRGLVDLIRSFVEDVRAGTHGAHGWPSSAYSVSKIGLNALVRVIARELEHDPRRILVNSENPGWVRTRMGGSSAPRSVEEGAHTAVWLATLPEGGPTGGFFRDEKPIPW
jgi:carbonyl reductase 1